MGLGLGLRIGFGFRVRLGFGFRVRLGFGFRIRLVLGLGLVCMLLLVSLFCICWGREAVRPNIGLCWSEEVKNVSHSLTEERQLERKD